jgi:class 3 adenylate cyclase
MSWFNNLNLQPKLLITYAFFLIVGTMTIVLYTSRLNGMRSDVDYILIYTEDVERMLLVRALFSEQHLAMNNFARTGSEEAIGEFIALQDRSNTTLASVRERFAYEREDNIEFDDIEQQTLLITDEVSDALNAYNDAFDEVVTLYDVGETDEAQDLAQELIDEQATLVAQVGEQIEDFSQRRQVEVDSLQFRVNEASRSGIFVGAVAIGVLFVLGTTSSLVTNSLTEPLTYLTNAIFAFENEQYNRELVEGYTTRRDEVGTLITSFDTMVNNITEANRNRERLLVASQRFVPEAYLEFLEKQSVADLQLGDHIAARMSVMFSDIRGFTTMSEGMTPAENFDFVNRYLREVSPMIQRYNGFIVKFLGDGMMAIFPYDVEDALRAAIAKQQASQKIGEALGARINLGVGIHIGDMMVGMIGEERRLQGDAFSDNVNLTARIEGLNKPFGTSILISEEARERIPQPDHFAMRRVGKVQVKGRETPITLYEVFEGTPGEEVKMATRARFYEGLTLYEEGNFTAAQEVFQALLAENPNDSVAAFYVEQTAYLLADPPAGEWDGVIVMKSK